MLRIKPVIMAGGVGERLWPISKEDYPKQFVRLFNNYSLLQNTLLRNKPFGKPIVISTEQYRFLAIEQINEVGIEATLVIEPCGKDTAACAMIGALMAKKEGADGVLLLPADHQITGEKEYLSSIQKATVYIDSAIVSIGITPSYPNIGYGYIKMGEQLGPDVYEVKEFMEKPNLCDAENYLKQGSCYWNSGVYLYRTDHLLKLLKTLQPSLFRLVQRSFNNALFEGNQIELDSVPYREMESLSFDKGIIELTCDRVVVRGDFAWNDLGSWDSIWRMSKKDEERNFLGDNVVVDSVSNSYVRSDGKTVAVIGLDNVVVINTNSGLLVANRLMLDKLHGLPINYPKINRNSPSYSEQTPMLLQDI